ncbi:MAG: hypothetical protein H8E90_00080 [Anaerolineales bacterium]|nr:hypothetical protein [Anaerolineales bacterium]
MIEKRLVQWYAADVGVDLDIAEREIVLTYVLRILSDWETRYAFDPAAFLAGLPEGKYDWTDLSRLVRRDQFVAPDEIVRDVQQAYAFLRELTVEEARLAADPYGRERQVYRQLVDSLKNIQVSLR